MLDTDELKRRIDAARTIRGLRQIDLAALVEADGLGKQAVGRLERGDIPLTRALRRSLADHLRVPESWFTDEELDLSPPMPDAPTDERLDRLETTLVEAVAQGSKERQAIMQLLASQDEILQKLTTVADSLPNNDALKTYRDAVETFNTEVQRALAATQASSARRAAEQEAPGAAPRRREASG